MSYQALYRKWRPETFDQVIGQDAVITTLKNQVRSGRIGHAYLFCGTRGTGKTSSAKILARAVNCPHAAEHDGNPCNVCEVCTGIKSGRAMNVFEIDAASNNGVDNIREIRDQVEYPPVTGRFKVYIIDEVHMLSPGAFNALLKTLEEPPGYVIFILATTDPQKIPATILSRCQRYDFKRMSKKTAAAHLKEITEEENLKIEDKALLYLAEAGDGSMRDALSLLDQCMAYHYGECLTYEHVLEILGAADTAVYSGLYRQILNSDPEGALATLNDLINSGTDIIQVINDFIWYLRNVLLAGSVENGAADILDISADRLEQAKADAALSDKRELILILGALAELVNRARFSSQKRVLLEVELIRLCTRKLLASAQAPAPVYTETPAGGTNRPAAGIGMGGETQAEPGSSDAPRITPVSAKIRVALTEAREDAKRVLAQREAEEAREEAEKARAEAEAQAPAAEAAEAVQAAETPKEEELSGNQKLIRKLEQYWPQLVAELLPSNRSLFGGVVLKDEGNAIVMLFKNRINFQLAANNSEENGVLKLRDLASRLTGENVKFMARIARPGEIEVMDNRVTDEEIALINFPVDYER